MPDVTPSPASLLLVDDDHTSRGVLARALRADGYAIVEAAGGREALTLVERDRIDLVLLDIEMPDLSGLDVLRAIRGRCHADELPVIMVTADGDNERVVEALDLGANDYVTKPYALPVLRARIRTQLTGRQARALARGRDEGLSLAWQTANDGLWTWDLATSELLLSDRWKAILGFEPHELPDEPASWLDRIHPQDASRVREELDAHLRGANDRFSSEHRLREKGGGFRWVLVRGLATARADGLPSRFAGALTDLNGARVTDALTGMPNRTLLLDRVGRLIEQQRRAGLEHFALLLVDVDHFRLVNAGLGYELGDHLLVEAAQRLQRCLRSSDTVARIHTGDHAPGTPPTSPGGDEFAVIVTAIRGDQDAAIVAERIQAAFARPFQLADHALSITASLGIATSRHGYSTADDVLRDAGLALARARSGGLGRWELFDPSLRTLPLARRQIEADLQRALERHEFVLHYQPIVALGTSCQLTGVEALVRWQHPEQGLVGPDTFVPVAEESGLIVPLGFWILAEACTQLRAWRSACPARHALVMSVNLSPRQLALPDLVERILTVVQAHAVPTSAIELEVTEGCVLTDTTLAQRTLRGLKEAGFRLAIDDFGTGFAAVSYLDLFPVDRLKIDRSYVQRAQASPEAARAIEDILALARERRLDVVAEGISTPSALSLLRDLACGYGQGSHFAQPLPADRLAGLLASGATGDWPARANPIGGNGLVA
jgi:diguanylate cyclase (GGDEF)-like protein/PAS domain S-box-containing protein